MTVHPGVALLTVVIVYALLLVAGTAHMSAAQRADALLPWRGGGVSVWSMHVRMGQQRCEFDNRFIGDGVIRSGNRCVLDKEVADRERKRN